MSIDVIPAKGAVRSTIQYDLGIETQTETVAHYSKDIVVLSVNFEDGHLAILSMPLSVAHRVSVQLASALSHMADMEVAVLPQ